MEQKYEVCKNCAYAVTRSDTKTFKWCKYECTYHVTLPEGSRRIAYKYEHDSCEYFKPTDRPQEG